jgi:hypothetical protein
VTELAAIVPSGPGVIYTANGWTRGFGNYSISYEHGYSEPPARIRQAALLWAKSVLVKGPIDDRTTSFSNDEGTFSLATPGMRGSWTGIPEVDATIQQYSLTAAVA